MLGATKALNRFAAAAHLLRHLRCNARAGGLTCCSDLSKAPATQLLASIDALTDFPLVMFADSSWQDCPNTSRSTGCYLVCCQGGLVDAVSLAPDPIALSSAEAEHQIAAFGVSGCEHARQLFQELHGLDPDTPLTIPILTDSQSAMAVASSDRDTRRTRHIRRRCHCVRLQITQGAHIILLKSMVRSIFLILGQSYKTTLPSCATVLSSILKSPPKV
jgi:hypothetical protein